MYGVLRHGIDVDGLHHAIEMVYDHITQLTLELYICECEYEFNVILIQFYTNVKTS